MRVVNLIYWNSDNFGDALNPLLIEELSGLSVQYKNTSLTRKERLSMIVRSLSQMNFNGLKTILFPWQSIVACIGSIISWTPEKAIIWGAGFMNQHETFKGGNVLAVRGKLTDQKLEKDGHVRCNTYGDPALLLPLWIKPIPNKANKLGIIPHWKEVDFFIEHYGQQYHIIDLRTRDVEKVIREICTCEYILSTSLHGIIVPQAYGIPALWIKKGYIDTDGFKFHDYFSSVDIPFYDGFDFKNILSSDENWKNMFDEHKEKAKINNSLTQIQSNLIRVAPFPLTEKYKKAPVINEKLKINKIL